MEELSIFKEVMKRFQQKEEIEDEVLFYILDTMSERFVESRNDSEWQCYDHMLDRLNKVWQYKQFQEISSEQSYLYGAIWGALSMLSSIKKKKTISQKSYTLSRKYDNNSAYNFLDSILKRPGLQNKDLADLCNVSNARISQIARDALNDGLISIQHFGKEKSYYIRSMGESVHDIVQKNRETLIEKTKSFDYKTIAFSNEEDDFLSKCKRLNLSWDSLDKNYKVVVAVAIGNKHEEIQWKDVYELKYERNGILCSQGMSNLSNNFVDFWEVQKETNMINQL